VKLSKTFVGQCTEIYRPAQSVWVPGANLVIQVVYKQQTPDARYLKNKCTWKLWNSVLVMLFIGIQTGCKLSDLCSFCVSVQAKSNSSACSHPHQHSHDQTQAALKSGSPLGCPRGSSHAAKSKPDLLRGMYQHMLFPWHAPASSNQHRSPTKHHSCAPCTTLQASAWGLTHISVGLASTS